MVNKTEAIRVQTVLRWALGITDPDRPVTDDDARWALADLADRARKALGAGITRATVENTFDEQQPAVVRGHRFVVQLNPADIRAWYAHDGCTDCDDGDTNHLCELQELARITDEQLDQAADELLRRGMVVDEAGDEARRVVLVRARQLAETAGAA